MNKSKRKKRVTKKKSENDERRRSSRTTPKKIDIKEEPIEYEQVEISELDNQKDEINQPKNVRSKVDVDQYILEINLEEVDKSVNIDGSERKQFPCKICSSSFDQYANFKNHMNTHNTDVRYQCTICGKVYDWHGVRKHIRQHLLGKNHSCNLCGTRFRENEELKIHKIMVHNVIDQQYDCGICGARSKNRTNLWTHMYDHMGVQYTLDFIRQVWKSSDHFQMSECDTCFEAFETPYDLQQHILKVHVDDRKYQCTICDKKFDSDCNRKRHEQRYHTLEKPYACEICNERFALPYLVEKHMICHSENRKHVCDLCGKGFLRATHLTYHKRRHTGERPYGCTICEKRFVTSGQRTKHMVTHSEEKPFKCELCDMRFNFRGYLNDHMKSHVEGKPFECDICGKTFKYQKAMKHHLKTHVRDEIAKGNTIPEINENKLSSEGIDMAIQQNVEQDSFANENKMSSEDIAMANNLYFETLMKEGGENETEENDNDFEDDILMPLETVLTEEDEPNENEMNVKQEPLDDYDIIVPEISIEEGEEPLESIVDENEAKTKPSRDANKKYKCEICHRGFSRRYRMREHYNTHIRKQEQMEIEKANSDYECKHCHQQFQTLIDLYQHTKNPKDCKPFKCKLCGGGFKLNRELEKHYKETECKPYQCLMCPRKFAKSTDLEVHSAEEHLLECKVCHKKFKDVQMLKVHSFMHPSK